MSDGSEQISCPDVGGILKRQREHQSLTVQQVAAELHLRPSIIVSIESNAFDDVPGVTFLRGYVKSYARLLKLSESEISSLLQQALDYDKNASLRKQAESESANGGTRGALYLVLVFVLIGALGGWLYQSGLLGEFLSGEVAPVAEEEFNVKDAPIANVSVSPSQSDFSGAEVEESVEKSSSMEGIQASFDQPQAEMEVYVGEVEEGAEVSATVSDESELEESEAGADAADRDLISLEGDTGIAETDAVEEGYVEEATVVQGESELEAIIPDTSETATEDVAELDTAELKTITPADHEADLGIEDSEQAIEQTATASGLPPIEVLSETEIAGSAGEVSDQASETIVTEETAAEVVSTEMVSQEIASAKPPEAENEVVEKVFGELKARFSGDCWFQVQNGDGRTVIASLKKSGQESSYRGPLPFTVVIGAVSEITMMFNDQDVDFSQYRVRNNRTDFVLK